MITKCFKCGEEGHVAWHCPHPPERAARMLARETIAAIEQQNTVVSQARERLQVAPATPHSNAQSPSRRNQDTEAHTDGDDRPSENNPSPDTSDIAPSLQPILARLPNVARGGTFIAPPGECVYCDRRRAATAQRVRSMRLGRKQPK